MATSGGQLGNDNATKNRPFLAALNRALAQGDPEKLRMIAEKLIAEAEKGEQWAIKELADRLDGKPKQQLEHTGKDDSDLLGHVTITYVRAEKRGD